MLWLEFDVIHCKKDAIQHYSSNLTELAHKNSYHSISLSNYRRNKLLSGGFEVNITIKDSICITRIRNTFIKQIPHQRNDNLHTV